MSNLSDYLSKFSETGKPVVAAAIKRADQQNPPQELCAEHLIVELAELKLDFFNHVLQKFNLKPGEYIDDLQAEMKKLPKRPTDKTIRLKINRSAKVMFKNAMWQAQLAGRDKIDAVDLICAFEEKLEDDNRELEPMLAIVFGRIKTRFQKTFKKMLQ